VPRWLAAHTRAACRKAAEACVDLLAEKVVVEEKVVVVTVMVDAGTVAVTTAMVTHSVRMGDSRVCAHVYRRCA
jgi:hypothetical protein